MVDIADQDQGSSGWLRLHELNSAVAPLPSGLCRHSRGRRSRLALGRDIVDEITHREPVEAAVHHRVAVEMQQGTLAGEQVAPALLRVEAPPPGPAFGACGWRSSRFWRLNRFSWRSAAANASLIEV